MTRFENRESERFAAMTDEELASEIKESSEYDADALRDLCWRAGMVEEWESADGESFEAVAEKAAEKLNVMISSCL